MMEIKILAAVCWPWVAVFASPANERNRVKNIPKVEKGWKWDELKSSQIGSNLFKREQTKCDLQENTITAIKMGKS